jgi:hypothetical protein
MTGAGSERDPEVDPSPRQPLLRFPQVNTLGPWAVAARQPTWFSPAETCKGLNVSHPHIYEPIGVNVHLLRPEE